MNNRKKDIANNISFVDFANKLKKDNLKKDYKEILKEHPEIYDIINENDKLKQLNEEMLDENISLGEEIEETKEKLKRYENKGIEKLITDNQFLHNEVNRLKSKINELVKKFENDFIILENEKKDILKSNKELRIELDKKRSIGGYVKDKTELSYLRSQVKDYQSKWSSIGRKKLPDDIIIKIIKKYHENWTYSEIANSLGIGKTSVYNYIKKYQKGQLNEIIKHLNL